MNIVEKHVIKCPQLNAERKLYLKLFKNSESGEKI